jgi:hypothetical protein
MASNLIFPLDFQDGIYPDDSQDSGSFPVPVDLPEPVGRFYRTFYGDEIPEINSFILTGRGNLRFQGVTLPARLRFTHDAGKGYLLF